MIQKNGIIGLLIIFLIGCISCEKNNNGDDTPALVKITETMTLDHSYTVELFAMDTLFVGYNKLYLSISEESSGNRVDEAEIELKPMMHMVTKEHSAPFENPGMVVNEDGYFEGAVVFIMPSNPDEGWSLDLELEISGTETTASLDIPVVKNLDEACKVKVTSEIDGTIYFLSRVEPMDPKVGINDCIFCVHYKESMMSFPAAEDLIITIDPEMPSMEHGSPNNVNPAHTSNGHYEGKINFTMTGWWRVHIKLMKNNLVVDEDAFLDITLN